jgi:hypothetical protein
MDTIMKTMLIRFLIVPTLFLASCSSVSFDTPLPESAPGTTAFSSEMVGTYYLTDSVLGKKEEPLFNALYFEVVPGRDSFDLISATMIIKEKLVYHTSKVISYYKKNKADTLRLREKHVGAKKIIKGKYVVYEELLTDTLLDLSGKDVLKLYKRDYYLNHCISKKEWNIYRLTVNANGGLAVHITNEADRDTLSKFAVSPPDNFGTTVHLSDLRFYEFVKNGGFRQRFRFEKYK